MNAQARTAPEALKSKVMENDKMFFFWIKKIVLFCRITYLGILMQNEDYDDSIIHSTLKVLYFLLGEWN